MRFLKRTKWLFWTLIPLRRPRECAFLFLFPNWSGCNQCNLEWLESNPQGHFVQCGIFPHEMTFCTESPSQAAQNVHFNGLEADQHSTKKSFDQHSTNFWKLSQFFLWETIFNWLRKLHSPNVLVFCGYSCITLLFDDNNAKITKGSPCSYLRGICGFGSSVRVPTRWTPLADIKNSLWPI